MSRYDASDECGKPSRVIPVTEHDCFIHFDERPLGHRLCPDPETCSSAPKICSWTERSPDHWTGRGKFAERDW